jgi:hypothetical protein
MFHQTPAGFDEALLQAGQRPSVDGGREHEPPEIPVTSLRESWPSGDSASVRLDPGSPRASTER